MGKSLRRLLNSMKFDKFNSLPASGEYCHHKVMTFANSMESMDPDQDERMSGLIWIQAVLLSDVIPEINF